MMSAVLKSTTTDSDTVEYQTARRDTLLASMAVPLLIVLPITLTGALLVGEVWQGLMYVTILLPIPPIITLTLIPLWSPKDRVDALITGLLISVLSPFFASYFWQLIQQHLASILN